MPKASRSEPRYSDERKKIIIKNEMERKIERENKIRARGKDLVNTMYIDTKCVTLKEL